MALQIIPAPAGHAPDYRFYRDTTTGAEFKTKAQIASPGPIIVNSVNVTPNQLAFVLTTSQVDAEGKALRDANGKPIVDSISHTFTPDELNAPGFDVTARINEIVAARIAAVAAVTNVQREIQNLVTAWGATPV